MAMRCENCGKGIMYGHNVSHAKNRTKRTFKPNLHKARIDVGGSMKRLKLCTKCLRLFKKGTSKKEETKKTKTETPTFASA